MLHLLLHYYKPYRKTLCFLLFLSVLTAALDLVFPILVRHILNVELPEKNMKSIFEMIGILFLLYCASFGLTYVVHSRGTLVSVHMENDMRQDLFRHLEQMSFRYFDENKTGQLLSRITTDLTEIGELTFKGPNDFIICSITMLGTIVILFWMNPLLASFIVLLLLAKTVHTVYINRKMKRQFRANRVLYGDASAQVTEALNGIRLIKAFALEEQEAARFAERCRTYIEGRRVSTQLVAYFSGSIAFFSNLINVVMMSAGGWLIITDRLRLSDFVAFLLYVNLFMKPLLRLTVLTELYQRGMAGFNRFYEIMQIEPEIQDIPGAVECKDIKGEIVFDHVHFSYGNGVVLKDLTLVVKPGEKIAFVGETGAGKTTIASLLLRFYEPQQGRILLDGKDIREYRQQSLRRAIGLVQQDVFLFSDSVNYNIAYGDDSVSQDEIKKAARLAAADEFIERLPETYDTCIGERGVKLSGGQKQRIAIARAFLKNPPVMVLDEATSSLDTATEKLVQESLDRLSANRTTITIAHRLSTIINSDRIFVLQNGVVAETGTHEELMNKNGIYKRLYELNKNE
ncbi:MAG: ABC transporter ATP-binding protein [Succiniclasticum sp.]|uniref:ABC transporter ATP-binding protein n=1 Tax=Succiniclasticum sp. TaxID=2775030 RepID=UPI002A90A719|nr:ABC transporter ATP-binding protein [Succiniclasticum sp.]MDY6292335.1 ABC transporter ATP-binding protein [Succiniclasticum sp.]